ncbi:MAG: PD-(D/E)XK nuclease family protein [Odoribacteraceae bacterium]|jgi:hypothetical protein|nr:PD-(D/E)XK nuclease family protein [Odoribacteraceae bacterium]
MDSFLKLLARDLAREHAGRLDRLTVIFPNKRAGLFLARELAALIDRPAWMPGIVTLEEFVERHTGLRRADDLTLVVKLYHAYRASSGSEESFDDFYFWGSMLLEDFDDVDKYLVDARDLFSNLRALKEVEKTFPYLTAEQVALVRRFWSHFHREEPGRAQLAFLETWERLYPAYLLFRERLRGEGLCYEGMGARLFLERLDEVDPGALLLFAGFNALNKCEEAIFSHFRDNGQARFYWDYDAYYRDNEAHEAGMFLRDNLRRFPNALDPGYFDNFRRAGKRLEHVSVPSATGQAKLLPLLLGEFAPASPVETAIVLCDERLLTPVLHAIPPAVEKINVTMGYPARETAAASLLSLACEARRHERRQGGERYYYHKPVVALLNHPLVRGGSEEEARRLARRVRVDNLVYVPAAALAFDGVTRAVFDGRATGPFVYLLGVLDAALAKLSADARGETAIEKEVLFALRARVQQLHDLFREEGVAPGERLHARLVDQVICSLSVPFSGEPLEGMQVMGLLETRLLDFKKLIVLSVNEGVIPGSAPLSSFIPYNLRAGFGLPTPGHRDAIYAYHFYRLLQRADEVKLLYADAGKNAGEMSRFLYQLKYESGLPVRERYLQNEISARVNAPISIPKDEGILRYLERYTVPGQGLSPSALNAYLDCRLKFYFRYVAGIREKEELAEELDQRLLGNVFHETMRALYATLPGGLATAVRLEALARDEALVERHARAALAGMYDEAVSHVIGDGTNELALAVVKKYVKKVVEFDGGLAPFTVLSMERKYSLPFPAAGGRVVYIEGNIDRADRQGAGVRVIDYKTGADKGDFKSVDSLFDRDNRQRNKAAFQILLYCLMYAREHPGEGAVRPGIYSTRLLFTPRHDYRLACGGTPVDDFRSLEGEFREALAGLLDELFSPGQPFTRTGCADKCRSCPYNALCAVS